MHQTKKNPNDPDAQDISADIVALAKKHGFIKGPFNLYLHGDLTWQEALELMVITMCKEYGSQSRLLVTALQERGPSVALATGIARALPSAPLPAPVPRLTDSAANQGAAKG